MTLWKPEYHLIWYLLIALEPPSLSFSSSFFSKEILCARATVDHNYYAVCQTLLSRHATWRGTSGGLLHDPPSEIAKDGRLEALLDECANPKKRYGRFQAAKELREYLAQLSNNVR